MTAPIIMESEIALLDGRSACRCSGSKALSLVQAPLVCDLVCPPVPRISEITLHLRHLHYQILLSVSTVRSTATTILTATDSPSEENGTTFRVELTAAVTPPTDEIAPSSSRAEWDS